MTTTATQTVTPATEEMSNYQIELCSKMVTRASRFALLAALHPRCGASSIIGRTLDSTLIRYILRMFDGTYSIPSAVFPNDTPEMSYKSIMRMIMKNGVIQEYVALTSMNDLEITTTTPINSATIIEKYPRLINRLVPYCGVRDPPDLDPCMNQRSITIRDIFLPEFARTAKVIPHGWYRETLEISGFYYCWRFDMIVDRECDEPSSVIIFSPLGGPEMTATTVVSKERYTINKPCGPDKRWRTNATRVASAIPADDHNLPKSVFPEFDSTGVKHLTRMISDLHLPTVYPGTVIHRQIRITLSMVLGV